MSQSEKPSHLSRPIRAYQMANSTMWRNSGYVLKWTVHEVGSYRIPPPSPGLTFLHMFWHPVAQQELCRCYVCAHNSSNRAITTAQTSERPANHCLGQTAMPERNHVCTAHIDPAEGTSFRHTTVLPDCCTVRSSAIYETKV